MKKLLVFLSLLSLLSTSTILGFGQGRPRRVGQQTTAPDAAAPAQAPTKPPVLGGANYPNSRQPETQQNQPPAGPEEVDAGDVVRVETSLVTIPVSVMDRDGRYVPNLQKGEFRIWEDGVEQEVAFFQSVDKPFSVVLMLDTSPSTQFRLEDIQDAAISFIDQLRSDDKVMVVSFNDDIKILSEFTTDRGRLHRAIQRSKTDDGTRLYDAVDMVINQQLNRVQGRKAIVLFTDGVDTTSRHASYQSNMMDAQELDALIYPVQYDTSEDMNANGGNSPVGRPGDVWGQILGGIFGGGRRGGGRRGGGAVAAARREMITTSRINTCWNSQTAAADVSIAPTRCKTCLTPLQTWPKSCDASTASAITLSARLRRDNDDRSRCAHDNQISPFVLATATSSILQERRWWITRRARMHRF